MNKDVKAYINKQPSPQKEILIELRKIIIKALPKIKEEYKLGVPFYENMIYIVGLKDHVNLGVSIKGLSKKHLALLEGAGKTMRHIKYFQKKDIDVSKILDLLKKVKPCSTCCGF